MDGGIGRRRTVVVGHPWRLDGGRIGGDGHSRRDYGPIEGCCGIACCRLLVDDMLSEIGVGRKPDGSVSFQ